jgi:hypothetical protein
VNYEVIESKSWRNNVTGARASIYGACPWTSERERPEWEIVVNGFTVRNPYTGEVGVCRPAWATREAAEKYAAEHRPNRISYGA